jgi:hypothetical protein
MMQYLQVLLKSDTDIVKSRQRCAVRRQAHKCHIRIALAQSGAVACWLADAAAPAPSVIPATISQMDVKLQYAKHIATLRHSAVLALLRPDTQAHTPPSCSAAHTGA